jgi:PAS domain S-box-containing protein
VTAVGSGRPDHDRIARLIVDSALDFAIITIGRDGLVTSWSTGAETVFGWSEANLIGRSGTIIFTDEDRAAGSPENEMQRSLVDGRAVDERWHVKKDGSRFWGSGLMMPLLSKEGRHEGFLKMVRDRTTEREAERRYQLLTDVLPGFVFVCDTDGHNVQVNGRYRDYTGRAEHQLLGDKWLDVIHPDDRLRARDIWQQAVATGENYEGDYRFRDAHGDYRSFACRGVPERDEQGRILRWLGTCVDAEKSTQTQAALEGLARDLEHAATDAKANLGVEREARSIAEDALRQSQKMEAIGQLTGGVAHDFNNLLTVIRGSVDILRRPDLPEEKRARYIDAIAETADRAAQLTAQLLAFARRQPLQPQVFDAAERMTGLMEVLRTIAGSRIAIERADRCAPCFVRADPVQFDSALVNMAVNARDAMADGGRLTLTIREADSIPPRRNHEETSGHFLVVDVADTGAGIPSETLSRIFEPFFTTKEVGRGTGLGLSQVFGFAKQSHGEVLVESEVNAGTTFSLYLPRAEELVSPPEQPLSDVRERSTNTGCILVVEDNSMVGDFAARLLEDLGYDSIWAGSAVDALKLLEESPDRFDLVFTDVVMPGMSGLELAAEIEKRELRLPVVLTSGYSHVLAEEGSNGLELLQKPYTADGLSRLLQKILGTRLKD